MGPLQQVRVNRRVPLLGQRFQRADVVEVAVRHDNRGGTRIGAKARFGCVCDKAAAHYAGINQNPLAVAGSRRSEKHQIGDG